MINKKNLTLAGNFTLRKGIFVQLLLVALFTNICYAKMSRPAFLKINFAENLSYRINASHLPLWPQKYIHTENEQKKYKAAFINILFSASSFITSFQRNTRNDTLPFNVIKKDRNNIIRYLINGTFFINDSGVSFSLKDSLILNYKRWRVSPLNRIHYKEHSLLISNFFVSYDTAFISISSRDSIAGSPFNIEIKNVDIGDLAGIINIDTLVASGLLDARIEAGIYDKKLSALTGTGSVKNLAFMLQPVGEAQLNVKMTDENTIHAKLGIEGKGNNINTDLNYCLNSGPQQLEALLIIKELQTVLLKSFIKSNVTLGSGSMNGVIALNGKIKQPEWKGLLNFDSVLFTLNQFGTRYLVDRQKIKLDYPAIGFNGFTVKDSLGNPLIINGNIFSKGKAVYDLDLKLNSHDFTLMSTSKAISNQVYGHAGIESKLSVTGTTLKPFIEGDILLNDKTIISIVLPEKNTNEDAAKAVVKFIRKDTFLFSGKENLKRATIADTGFATFLNDKLNIRTSKQAALTFVIDPSTGDQLTIKGITKLNAGIKPGGNMVMSGTYQVDSGYYQLNYQFLHQRFNIMPGGSINFSGSPGYSKVNVQAEYLTNTSAQDLLGNEIGVINPKIARSLKEKIPFRVILSLKGSLSNPIIGFDIELAKNAPITPQLKITIENKLVQLRSDVAATNKQVFALLVLDRFVGEQSTDFFKGNGGDFSDVSTESVSKFLSASLDQIASDLFKGINLDLNLNSYQDFTSNDGIQKADLNLDLSKNFLNDRLTVTVGKNFGIESRDASTKASQQKASRFLPDVTVNYKLSADGKYMFRSYKKNPFEMIVDGYVVETGVAFIVTIDYEKFVELKELVTEKNKKTGE